MEIGTSYLWQSCLKLLWRRYYRVGSFSTYLLRGCRTNYRVGSFSIYLLRNCLTNYHVGSVYTLQPLELSVDTVPTATVVLEELLEKLPYWTLDQLLLTGTLLKKLLGGHTSGKRSQRGTQGKQIVTSILVQVFLATNLAETLHCWCGQSIFGGGFPLSWHYWKFEQDWYITLPELVLFVCVGITSYPTQFGFVRSPITVGVI